MDQQQNEVSIPSNELAEKLVEALFTKDAEIKQSLDKLLILLKNKKNPQHKKFTNYIKQNLQKTVKGESSDTLDLIFNSMHVIGKKMVSVGNSEPERNSIANGYRIFLTNYISKKQITNNERVKLTKEIIKEYFAFQVSFAKTLLEMLQINFSKLSEFKQRWEKQIVGIIIENVRFKSMREDIAYKCCLAINILTLYRHFKIQDLVHFVKNIQNYDIGFYFSTGGEVNRQLLNFFIEKEFSQSQKKIKKLFQAFKLEVTEFPNMMKQLHKKSLRYYLRSQPIFAIDLKIKSRQDLADPLIQILIDDGRYKQALHFINKYQVKRFYHLNQGNFGYQKNILEHKDQFLPTEMILMPHSAEQYIRLEHFGYKQQNVMFVSVQNLTEKILSDIFNSPQFGIDCENKLVFSAYEKAVTEIVQIALNYKSFNEQQNRAVTIKVVYILDFLKLLQISIFREWLQKLSAEYQGQIVGHSVEKDFYTLLESSGINSNTQNLKFIDIAVLFKEKNKQTKSSLQYISNTILKKKLSKYEQCSPWSLRPLRKAQLHYAALDAVLPLILLQQI